MSDRRSDRELVARVQEGDRRAFDLLVIKYQHKVASLISRYIRDPGEVMDIAQEVFLKAYRVLPGGGPWREHLLHLAVSHCGQYGEEPSGCSGAPSSRRRCGGEPG